MSTQPDSKQAKLNELYELGKSKGVLTYDEIISRLSSYEIDPEQFDSILGSLTYKPPGKPTLVPDTDKRPALNTANTDFMEE